MNITPTRISNILICDRDNFLRSVDIIFDEKIREIRPRSPRPVLWKDIALIRDHRKYIAAAAAGATDDTAPVIDGKGLLLMPGAIDPHVHFNTPGYEARDDFEHGSLAAACGGVTTVIDMPCTSVPPVTAKVHLETKLRALKGRSCIDYALWGGISGTVLDDLAKHTQELAAAGVAGFKAYLISGMEEFTALSLSQLLAAAGSVRKTGLPLAVHAEHHDLVAGRRRQLIQQDKRDWQAYCTARDVLAEAAAIAELREICRQTGCRMHIVHLSSKRGLTLVREARAEQLPLSAETCPHYLHFTREDFDRPEIARLLKTAPPVKAADDRQALWQGLTDDSLAFVTTDHAGCDPQAEKSAADFWQVYGGIPGVEHRVPFLFSEGFKQGRLTLEQTIAQLSGSAARYFGLAGRKGALAPGRDADLAVIDLWRDQVIRAQDMHSKGKYTPFEGMTFGAVVSETWLRGRQLTGNCQPVNIDYGYGQWLRPG